MMIEDINLLFFLLKKPNIAVACLSIFIIISFERILYMKLPLFTTFVIFCVLVSYIAKKNTVNAEEINHEFFERERKANSIRRQPIDHLPYIHVPVESLPLDKLDDINAREFCRVIKELGHKQILNLTGISNTDLKLQYGAANLSTLTECDQNYTVLVRNIAFLAEIYMNNGLRKEAITLLEYGISIGTDVKKNYDLLGAVYAENKEYDKIQTLITTAETVNSLSKDAILNHLKELSES